MVHATAVEPEEGGPNLLLMSRNKEHTALASRRIKLLCSKVCTSN